MGRTGTLEEELRRLGLRIRDCRERAGLTQEEAATQSDIDVKRWQRIEAGDVNPTVRTLHRVAKVLGVDLDELFARIPSARD